LQLKGCDFPRTPWKCQLLQVHDQSNEARKDLINMEIERHGEPGGKTQEQGYKRKRQWNRNFFHFRDRRGDF